MATPQPSINRAPDGTIITSFIQGDSGNKAAASAPATLTSAAARMAWITSFTVTASGATAGLPVIVTLTGPATAMNFIFTFPAGALVGASPLVVAFNTPVPASAVNTNIVVTCPSSGAGGTNCVVNVQGFLSQADLTTGT